jgi:peptide/nickel transport system substrate-binding protein
MRKPHRLRGLSVGLVLVLGVLAACAPPPPSPSAPSASDAPAAQSAPAAPVANAALPAPTQAPAARSAGTPGGTLRIGGETPLDDLDPHTVRVGWHIMVMQNVYSGLVRPGTDLLPQPDLAIRWNYQDPQTLEFTLRQGAKFHNGREVVAEDVKYTFERILDPGFAASYASYVESIGSIEAPERYRLVMHLKRPDTALLNNLAMPSMAIVPREVVEQNNGSLKTVMVGSGPFMFKENIPNQHLILVKNPDYFIPGQPLLDQLTFIPLPNETARTNALRSGEVDYIEPAAPKDVPALRNDRSLVVTGGPNLSFVGISLNTSRKPFDDARVRQALAYAISRDEVIQKAFDGFAQPLWGPPLIPPYWAGNTDRYYSLDPTKARQLLAEAGYPDGFKAIMTTSTTTSYHAAFATVVQAELKKIGVDIELNPLDGAVATANWRRGEFEMYPIRWWGSDFIDPDGAFRPTFTCQGSYNNSRFCYEPFDELILKGLTVSAVGDRKTAYQEAMKLLAEQQPWVFLVAFDRFQAMKSNVSGYTAFPNASQYGFREVWLEK